MTDKCIAFGCTTEAHSGANLCYKHLPARPLEDAKEELKLMKEELEAIRNYSCVLTREAEGIQSDAENAFKEAERVRSIADRKELAVKKFERELSRYE